MRLWRDESCSTARPAQLGNLKVDTFAMYVHDYGAPIGWRLALNRPESVRAIISQNGNAYEEGFVPEFWEPVWQYARSQTVETERAARGALTLESIEWQYLHGEPDTTLLAPETWHHDYQLVNRPGNDAIQLALTRDYVNNVALYPQVHQYFRDSGVPLLAVWGRNDGIFAAAGAKAFAQDLPNAAVELLDGGHFLLESAHDAIARLVLRFLDRLPSRSNH
jgi:pimeloyl-ACP methyl ester carboxylesterase